MHGFLATDILRFISSIVSFFMLVSYLVLPDKRRHPSLLILNVSASIFLFSMVVYFSIGNPQKLQCANLVSVSTQDNNILCATQGQFLLLSYISLLTYMLDIKYRCYFNFLIPGYMLLECGSYRESSFTYCVELKFLYQSLWYLEYFVLGISHHYHGGCIRFTSNQI